MDQPSLFPLGVTTCLWCMPDLIAERIDELGPRMEIFRAFKAVEEHFTVHTDCGFKEEPLQGSLLKAVDRIPERWQEFFRRVIFMRRDSSWMAGGPPE